MRRSKQSRQVVWHYTYSNNIAAISESGVLLPPIMCPNYTARMRSSCASHNLPTNLVDTKGAMADARLLLFSEREDWEPASFRGFRNVRTGELTDLHRLEDYAEYGWDVYRIGVQRGILHPWMRLKELVRMPHGMRCTGADRTRDREQPLRLVGYDEARPRFAMAGGGGLQP